MSSLVECQNAIVESGRAHVLDDGAPYGTEEPGRVGKQDGDTFAAPVGYVESHTVHRYVEGLHDRGEVFFRTG